MSPPTIYSLTYIQCVNTPPSLSCIDKYTADSSIWIGVLLTFICLIYVALIISGTYLYRPGGFVFDGNIGTLTTALAISGVLLNLLSLGLRSQCRSAGLQSIAKVAIDTYVTLVRQETMNIAVIHVWYDPGYFRYDSGLFWVSLGNKHLWKHSVDFRIIQIMKMQDAVATAGIGCDLDNYCSRPGEKLGVGVHKVAIRILSNRVLDLWQVLLGTNHRSSVVKSDTQ
jgi:hypothetical protein